MVQNYEWWRHPRKPPETPPETPGHDGSHMKKCKDCGALTSNRCRCEKCKEKHNKKCKVFYATHKAEKKRKAKEAEALAPVDNTQTRAPLPDLSVVPAGLFELRARSAFRVRAQGGVAWVWPVSARAHNT